MDNHQLTEREYRTKQYIANAVKRGINPTFEIIAKALGMGVEATGKVVRSLDAKGYIEHKRSLEGYPYVTVRDVPHRMAGSIACPRCGCRSDVCGHSAAMLSSGRVGGWQMRVVG